MPTTKELAAVRSACAAVGASQMVVVHVDIARGLLAAANDLATLRGLVREFETASKGHRATTAAAIADRMFAAVKP